MASMEHIKHGSMVLTDTNYSARNDASKMAFIHFATIERRKGQHNHPRHSTIQYNQRQ